MTPHLRHGIGGPNHGRTANVTRDFSEQSEAFRSGHSLSRWCSSHFPTGTGAAGVQIRAWSNARSRYAPDGPGHGGYPGIASRGFVALCSVLGGGTQTGRAGADSVIKTLCGGGAAVRWLPRSSESVKEEVPTAVRHSWPRR